MRDDDMMDEWLREAMAGETPRLSPRSDDKVIASVRPRRLSTAARLLVTLYAIGALALSAWTMREIGVGVVSASMPVAALIAVAMTRYVRRVIVLG
jgi:hypothetical protein